MRGVLPRRPQACAPAGLMFVVKSPTSQTYNITVNSIAPGFFATNIGGGHARNPEVQRTLARTIPMHRVGFAEDIKGLALFLASPASAYITGQQIVIDGGWGLGAAD